jgi:hypothetical protein
MKKLTFIKIILFVLVLVVLGLGLVSCGMLPDHAYCPYGCEWITVTCVRYYDDPPALPIYYPEGKVCGTVECCNCPQGHYSDDACAGTCQQTYGHYCTDWYK